MCIERGFRGKLSMATITEAKSLHVILLCDKSKKASLKSRNPSVKGLCPFVVHYERKSFIGVNKGFRGEEYWEVEKPSKPRLSGPTPYKPLNQMYNEMKPMSESSMISNIPGEMAKKEEPGIKKPV